ncbi:hypothetical protein [Pseudomonas sp. RA_35y_Pfl2_P32]|uniref:hypothetical protein n=1 Tax=Pseudomonas sp. RA_35y_Pfl2_P32 TaxID=3088705 RepID=UPI0030DBF12C
MKTINMLAVACTVVAATVAPHSTAAANTEPVIALGLLGSYNELEFKGQSNDIERMPEGGLFLNYGNKLTGHAGLVFHAEISGQYSEKQGQRVKDLQADLDLGWRLALDANNFLDLLVGAGYKWNSFDPGYNKYDIELTNRTPFAKVAIGYNHQFDNSVLRLEAGARRSLEGDAQLEIQGVSNQTLDLQSSTDPYVELSVLFNQHGSLPIIASLYYNHFNYEPEGQFDFTQYDKQTRHEYGAKLGIVF